jgi:hypothetical protein
MFINNLLDKKGQPLLYMLYSCQESFLSHDAYSLPHPIANSQALYSKAYTEGSDHFANGVNRITLRSQSMHFVSILAPQWTQTTGSPLEMAR